MLYFFSRTMYKFIIINKTRAIFEFLNSRISFTIKADRIKIRQIDPEKYLNCGIISFPPTANIIIGSINNKDSINIIFLFFNLLNKQNINKIKKK